MNIEGDHSYSGILDWISGVDSKNIAAGQEAERKNAELTRKLAARKGVSAESITNPASVSLREMQIDPKTSVGGGFKEGLAEGAANIRQGVGSTINTAIGTTFSLIPWQVWLALGIGAYLYFNPGLLKRFTGK